MTSPMLMKQWALFMVYEMQIYDSFESNRLQQDEGPLPLPEAPR